MIDFILTIILICLFISVIFSALEAFFLTKQKKENEKEL